MKANLEMFCSSASVIGTALFNYLSWLCLLVLRVSFVVVVFFFLNY